MVLLNHQDSRALWLVGNLSATCWMSLVGSLSEQNPETTEDEDLRNTKIRTSVFLNVVFKVKKQMKQVNITIEITLMFVL